MNKIAFDERTMKLLEHYAKPAGIGAGVGALGMGAANLMSDEPEDQQPSGLMKSMLMGAGLGGATGAGARGLMDLTGPNPTSPAGLKKDGFPDQLPSSHWLKKLTQPFASKEWGGSPYTAGATAGGVGVAAQYGANKGIAHFGTPPVDMSKVKVAPLTWAGHNTVPAGGTYEDPYFNNVIKPAREAEAIAANPRPKPAAKLIPPPRTALRNGAKQPPAGKPRYYQAPTPASQATDAGVKKDMDAFMAAQKTNFDRDVETLRSLKRNDGSIGREGHQYIANNSPRVKLTDQRAKNWNSALGNHLHPDNEQIHRVTQIMGPGGADVSGKMNRLQKFRAAIQNPFAELAAQVLPKSHVYAEADLPGVGKLRKGMNWLSGKAKAHNLAGVGSAIDKVTPSRLTRPPRDLDPTYIQPSQMKAQLPFSDGLERGPNGRLNRYAYRAKDALVDTAITGKVPKIMGRGRYAIGPAVAAATYFGGQHLHDSGMEKALQELSQNGGPQAASKIRELAEIVQRGQQNAKPQQ